MKLADLNPKWITPHLWANPALFATGVSFLCPHCDPSLPEQGPDRRRLNVMFFPPIDEDRLQEKYGPGWWPKQLGDADRVHGETFDTLTLSPSINFDGHWGGIINGGELTP